MFDQSPGISGRLKKLLDRIPEDAPTKLGRVDVDVSSRASAALQVSNQVLTDARVQSLDRLDVPVSNAAKSPVYHSQIFASDTTWSVPADLVGGIVLVTAIGGGGGGPQHFDNVRVWGGESGEWVFRRKLAVSGSVSIVIGAAGLGATANGEGTDGGDTTVDALTLSGGRRGAYDKLVPPGQIGAPGGYYDPANRSHTMPAFAPGCAVAGVPGRGFGAGAGGLDLVEFQVKAADGGAVDDTNYYVGGGGIGYGAGGAAGQTAGGNAAPGVVMLEWWEWESA